MTFFRRRIIPPCMVRLTRTGLFFPLISLLMALTGCDDRRFYEKTAKIPEGIWRSDNILPFPVVISDTLATYNLYIDIRNDLGYQYSNLYIFFRTIHPNGRLTRDTIEFTLADYDGKWIGSGSGSLRSVRFMFQQGLRFRMTGNYLFMLEQAMRTEELKGIRDIGFRIDKFN